uniref:Uncharacterized protein n=1 Tax=Aegilops tauschii subsp. strangulata TaxID=200361 RepID=A0A453C2E6_AEGTS
MVVSSLSSTNNIDGYQVLLPIILVNYPNSILVLANNLIENNRFQKKSAKLVSLCNSAVLIFALRISMPIFF